MERAEIIAKVEEAKKSFNDGLITVQELYGACLLALPAEDVEDESAFVAVGQDNPNPEWPILLDVVWHEDDVLIRMQVSEAVRQELVLIGCQEF